MTAPEFRAALTRLHLSQSGLARELATIGDNRPYSTRLRTVQELASPSRTAPIPWAVACMVTLIEQRGGMAGPS